MPNSDLQKNVLSWLEEAGELIRTMLRELLTCESKKDKTPVTVIDRAVETLLRDRIMDTYPEHGIIGEEGENYQQEAEHLWLIDPIDGTKALLAGIPVFTTLIALVKDEKPLWGFISQPITRDLWIGQPGTPSVLNSEPIRTRPCPALSQALFSSSSPLLFQEADKPRIEMLYQKIQHCQFGADAYAYGRLASGNIDLIVESGLSNHDFMALIPVIEGAGGMITDWQGQPLTLRSEGKVCAAGSQQVHTQALEILNA